MADPRKVWEETFSVLKQILGMGEPLPYDAPIGIRDPEAFSHGSALAPPPLNPATSGFIPGSMDHLAEEQGLASDDPFQIGAKMEA